MTRDCSVWFVLLQPHFKLKASNIDVFHHTTLCPILSDCDCEKIYPHHTRKSSQRRSSYVFDVADIMGDRDKSLVSLFCFVYRPPLTTGQLSKKQTIIRSFDYSKSKASCAVTKYFLRGHLGYYCNQIR